MSSAEAAKERKPSAQTTSSMVYDRLREEILCGERSPGSRLIVDKLRQTYGTGVSPIREALNRLSSEGLVDREELRGFQVAPLSVERLDEIVTARRLIETAALAESIANGDSDWEESVWVAFYRLKKVKMSIEEQDGKVNPEWRRFHDDFHRSLISACGSQILLDYADQLREFASRYIGFSMKDKYLKRDILDEHQSIMDAALARNVSKATKLLEKHYEKTAANIRRSFADQP